ncbi:uncharacterized protein DFL_001503 [Arthrobotrys flagrans]|uniref:Rhodopsin domain-containing protein n=1 Tax=Arthrobotrys flagrans TaxID=97331 RepID=A0A437A825_ARTFL|nr:hypothetical protein DFL_001503 [Arthrobotrys flagrans]
MGVSGDAAIAVEWGVFAITSLFVGLKVFARHRAGRLGFSDILVGLTWLMFLITNTCDNELWRRGLYRDNLSWKDDWSEVIPDPDTWMTLMKISYAFYFPYILELWGVKFSFLALYYGLVSSQLPKLRLTLHFITGYTAITLIISIVLNLAWCTPISRNWALDSADRTTCFTGLVPTLVPVVFHISSNFALYLFPFVLLNSLRAHLPGPQFNGILVLFGLGAVYIGVTIGRFIANGDEANIPTIAVWTAMEMAVGLIVVCCPALKVLFPAKWKKPSPVHLQSGINDSTDGKDGETVKSWPSVRTRSTSKTSEGMGTWYRGSVDTSDLEMETQTVQTQFSNSNQRRSGRSSQQRFLSRISQSREGLVREPEAAHIPGTPPLGSTPLERRKPSRDGAMYPPSEFKVEESLRRNNGNVQESVNALRDDILRSISFAYDEQSYNHDHHTHVQPRKTSREGWR